MMKPLFRNLSRILLTLAILVAAAFLVRALWQTYVLAPWTRDGRVSAHVVQSAPEVSGTVVEVAVRDNQYVRQGEVLYRISPQRFELAVEEARARLAAAEETLRQRLDESRRRHGLDDILPREDIQRAGRSVAIARTQVRQAQASLEVAELDLARSVITAPVEGYITHLRLQAGDYAVSGQPNLTLLDANSFWVTGYFEETKLPSIRSGATARIRLMGHDEEIEGHVESIGRGIADENDVPDSHGLPAVNPTFSWVRLAQRIPVRIALDKVPEHIVLAAGMTCSVAVDEPGAGPSAHGRLASWLSTIL
ncbi:HlyD family secretion protein [Kerstersia gyiorum]|uniref:RND family efflux transporter MFP subunit n=2 Tax=Kerstersia gyiorum TaxID=206506 RepID=A0A4Q7MS34_9BURK|nr:HlyD family secretion protein [Kerstersia gyiorum]MCP1633376.1 multidrug resistance efflux pump [Kerstersia gyiorum]MCP1671185.1 multidrug resistance efflux pump [Kerstersia gyiorum]MCP1679157.1 multidrug resistance efflux pump [Kerstersia gyiorum]MCP1681959.1 multidrug resistance efflux pump [Kerstersia gyiorum]MCP1709218.1 multidrug resistance efflux pump [Kerstersia gyiorum]